MKQLSTRERLLLSILAIAAVFAIYYYLGYQPQYDKLSAIKAEVIKQEEEKATLNQKQLEIISLEKAIAESKKNIDTRTLKYYPEILQDRLMLQIDNVLKKSVLKFSSISFLPVKLEAINQKSTAPEGDKQYPIKDLADTIAKKTTAAQKSSPQPAAQAGAASSSTTGTTTSGGTASAVTVPSAVCESMSATLSFNGNYDQLMRFLKEVEAMNKAISISNLNITAAINGEMAGTLTLNFYSIPKLQLQDDAYLNWPYNGSYGKTNPFAK